MLPQPKDAPISTLGVHHITFMGADRQTSVDFWSGVLGMRFVFEQPNLDDHEQNHLYFIVSSEMYAQSANQLKQRGFATSGEVDRGFMNSLYFRDPLGQLFELACYKFTPPAGRTHADVLAKAHQIRVAKGDLNIVDVHLAEAVAALGKGD
jgi:glyoxalase family protein